MRPPITTHARKVVYELVALMPSPYQQASLKAIPALFLEAQGLALPQHTNHKSASSLCRFLNLYDWPTRDMIRTLRQHALQLLLERSHRRGGRPILKAIIDLTPLEKSGKFAGLQDIIHTLNKKRGLQLVVVYLEVGGYRLPWSFRVWRGKGSASPAQLGLKLLRTLPKELTRRYKVMVLADGDFCSVEFLEGVGKLGHHGVVGVRRDRRLQDGARLDRLGWWGGREVYLEGMEMAVYVASFWLRRADGHKERRFVLSTKAISGKYIVRWGKRRWRIEGFFKTAKLRFSLQRFAQGTKLGVYRYLVLSLVAYLLAHWGHLVGGGEGLPDWGRAARVILEEVLSEMVVMELISEIEERRSLLQSHGFDVQVQRCKI